MLYNGQKLIIHSDGGARGNPGPAAIGVTIVPSAPYFEAESASAKNDVVEISEYIGEATNNQAEYRAVLRALEEAHKLGAQEVVCYLDSELVVRQLKHEYKVKNRALAEYFIKIHNLAQKFRKINFVHIPRERNRRADELVNIALDKRV